jgi:hypothetical protein
MWGEAGIILHQSVFDQATLSVDESLLVYDEAGNFIAETPLTVPEDDFIWRTFLMADGGREYIAVLYGRSGWALVDPLTGDSAALTGSGGAPELYNRFNPDGLTLLLTIDEETLDFIWWAAYPDGVVVTADGNTLNFAEDSLNRITPAPDSGFAFITNAVYVWRDERRRR